MLERLAKDPSEAVRSTAKRELPPEFVEAKEVPVPIVAFTDVKDITRPSP